MEEEDEVEHFVGVTEDENDNSDHIHEDKLHAEERRRLRYYYAAVECDCMRSANYIYNTWDVAGFERASIRYIPHCMEYNYPALAVAIGDDNELDRSRTFDQVAADIFGEEPWVEESTEGAERKGEEETEANAKGGRA
ncbi:hypothetical protein Pint_28474 [Pistacia integerrima]|uniref:Uncharacterized protein n=1 Tax=Pistacia integerrima TaxID=434235 RepID=A0ACC0YNW2_9ROSI|nr:hypothetical protein Pint_28474 [Pistacia integerrima]